MIKNIISVVGLIVIDSFAHRSIVVHPPGTSSPSFEEQCISYNIDVDEGWIPHLMGSNPQFSVIESSVDDQGEEQYRTTIRHALLRYEDSFLYSYICRIEINPIWKERNFGFLGMGSKFDDWYFRTVKVSCDLPNGYQIGMWSPMNTPSMNNNNYGISVGTNGFNISASVSYQESLEITSKTNIATRHFEVQYEYELLDDYSNNSIVYYCMFTFMSNSLIENANDFPIISFETIYYGKYYFHNHVKTFQDNPIG